MFYTFRQNNSGGKFKIDKAIKHYVVIEADNAEKANTIVNYVGIYFNGVEDGYDCPCCGDRWYKVDESDAKKKPTLYGKDITKYVEDWPMGEHKEYIIYYKNGDVKIGKIKEKIK